MTNLVFKRQLPLLLPLLFILEQKFWLGSGWGADECMQRKTHCN